MKIGEKLFNYRKTNQLTQSELGDKIGVSSKIISKWETGESLPSTELLPAIADCLSISIDALFDRSINVEYDVFNGVNSYFRDVPSIQTVTELQKLISYSIEAMEYRQSKEKGWYKEDVLAEIDEEWLKLIEDNDPRPMVFYDNDDLLKESVFNITNDGFRFVAIQNYGEKGFLKALDRFETFAPIYSALLIDGADRMIKHLSSNNAPQYITAEHLAKEACVSVEQARTFIDKLYNAFKDNLTPIRKVCIEGENLIVYPNIMTHKLQLVIASAYFAAENWGGER